MKKLITILAVSIALVACGKWSGEFTIKGQIDGFSMFDQAQLIVDGEVISSGIIADDNSFELKGSVTEPVSAMLIVDDGAPLMTIFIDGKNIELTGNVQQDIFEASGTPSNDAYLKYIKSQGELYARYDEAETDEQRKAIEDAMTELVNVTIAENNNVFGLSMLANNTYELSGAELLEKLGNFSEVLQNTKTGSNIRSSAEDKIKTEPGQTYIDFAMIDRDSTEIKLSNYVGKGYVLLDFWASWCGPCMAELPYLLDSYARYHEDGFEIFGVSLDRDLEDWEQAIDEHNMTWIHATRLMNPEMTADDDYAVVAIPSNFLIDPNGKIIAKNLRGEEVAAKLAEIYMK